MILGVVLVAGDLMMRPGKGGEVSWGGEAIGKLRGARCLVNDDSAYRGTSSECLFPLYFPRVLRTKADVDRVHALPRRVIVNRWGLLMQSWYVAHDLGLAPNLKSCEEGLFFYEIVFKKLSCLNEIFVGHRFAPRKNWNIAILSPEICCMNWPTLPLFIVSFVADAAWLEKSRKIAYLYWK